MTTIAWDGKGLAVDSQVSNGNSKCVVDKLIPVTGGRGGYVTGAGRPWDVRAMSEWLAGRTEGKPTISDPENFVVLHAYLENNAPVCDRYHSDLYRERLTRQVTEGSGRDFATAALHLGSHALAAVSIACEHDIYTCFPAQMFTPVDGKVWPFPKSL